MDGQKTNKLSDDHLSNTVSLRARITETDLSFSAKSRAIAALDRLIGATVDIPASMMEAWANKRRVAMHAAENLVSSSSEPEPEPGAKEVNPDWLNYFGGYAEKASSKNVRDLWGRVLAGEIRRPTSFSLTTLRILAELDQQIASLFEDVVKFRIEGKYILRPTVDEWNSGESEKFKLLEEVGLIEDANPVGNTSYISPRKLEDRTCLITEGNLCLRIVGDQEILLDSVSLTRSGRELCSILELVEGRAVLRRIGKYLSDRAVTIDSITMHSFARNENVYVLSECIEVLK